MDDPAIRSATHADVGLLAALHIASWQSAYRGLVEDAVLDTLSLDERRHYWDKCLRAPDMQVEIAEDDGTAVALSAVGPSRDPDVLDRRTYHLFNLHTAASHRGRGIGRWLFLRAARHAADRQAHELTLWVLRGNAVAQRFYESMGMRADGATRTEAIAPGVVTAELRYRIPLKTIPPDGGY